jgi:hypothetical protein
MLREWVAGEIGDGVKEVSAHALMPQAELRFRNDPEFQEALLRSALAELLPDVLRRLLGEKRGEARGMIQIGGTFYSREDLTAKVTDRLRQWYENGHNSTHVPLLMMTRGDLDYALAARNRQVQGHLRAIGFLEEIRDGLPEGATVQAHYTETELTRIYERYFVVNTEEEQHGDGA